MKDENLILFAVRHQGEFEELQCLEIILKDQQGKIYPAVKCTEGRSTQGYKSLMRCPRGLLSVLLVCLSPILISLGV